MIVTILVLIWLRVWHLSRSRDTIRRARYIPNRHRYYCRPKPEWVVKRVIRLKALMPHKGCRKIADIFNRQYRHSKHMTVSKSYVSEVIRKHQYAIQIERRRIKHRIPRPTLINRTWALDLTTVREENGRGHWVLGIIDHGSRANIVLQRLDNKASVTLLRALLNAVEQFGKPKAVRTDNEACLTSKLFRLGLWLLRIQHQRTDPHCPWMNGRVERFFGTLKERTRQAIFTNPAVMDLGLAQFRLWYNHVRPHQHLQGRTPTEVWAGKPVAGGRGEYFHTWDGVLTGFYFPS